MSNTTAAIKIAQKQLGLDDETYRAKLKVITGKTSTTQMTEAERQSVIKVFRAEGALAPRPKSMSHRQDGRDGKPRLSGKYLPKLRALWIAAYNLGIIDDRRDSALEAFALGHQLPELSDVRFIHQPGDVSSVVDAIKGMLSRHGVTWALGEDPLPYERRDGFKIAVAQWAKLNGSGSGHRFWETVGAVLKRPIPELDVSDGEWILVMNTFGAEIRRKKRIMP